jgi:hypothetical protein
MKKRQDRHSSNANASQQSERETGTPIPRELG